MTPDDVVMCDLQGNVKQGRRKPSSEINFHTRPVPPESGYRCRGPHPLGLCQHPGLPASGNSCSALSGGLLGSQCPTGPYATFGTPELAQSLTSTIGDCNAVLLANHGLVSVGPDIATAFAVAEEIEFVAQIYYQTLIAGDPKILTEAQMSEVLKKFKTYGQSKPSFH
jgi:L-fuculose-phosphate aldolase